MGNLMMSLAGTLEVVGHIVGWGLAIVLGALLAWELVAVRKRAKAEQNLKDGSSKRHTSNLSRLDAFPQAPEPAAKTNADVLSRITRSAVYRQ
jgi:hypothetical protein